MSANAFAESTNPQNEQGLYTRIEISGEVAGLPSAIH